MAKFKKGDKILFTFDSSQYLDLVPCISHWDTNLKIFGKGEIMGERSMTTGYYPVKVTNPLNLKGGNDLGGLLSGSDRGKGWYIHENALMFEGDISTGLKKSVGAQSDEAVETCPKCGAPMKELFISKYCPKCD